MKKITKTLIAFVLILASLSAIPAGAAIKHKVLKGQSMWLIAVEYQVGISEIIAANPQVKNPSLIYPDQILDIPILSEKVDSFEREVIRLTNEKRRQNGLSELKINWELSRIARYKSQDMHDRRYFSHTSPTYGSPFDMIKNFGIRYRSAGENIAMGQRNPQEVVNAWWNSPGHKANMLNASYNQIGVGYVESGNYWTQMFIGA